MQHEIKKYPVKDPLLKKYIKFFWVLSAEHMQVYHKLIPQRNINLRFNLSETPQYISMNEKEYLLEEIFFSGLQDHYLNAQMKLTGKVDMLGICFFPDGFYPFVRIPVSEFKNQVLGTNEIGFKQVGIIGDKLKGVNDTESRLNILERELLRLLNNSVLIPENFREMFKALNQKYSSEQISEFCKRNDLGLRKMERMYNKYVGIPAKTFVTLNRFQNSLNQLLYRNISKMSDIAFYNDYFDQTHFIKEFKHFSGNTPKGFVQQNNSILQIGKLI